MTDWYEENIEEPLRDIVRYLRNNGINTECSCGHDMYIQCQYISDGNIMKLHNLLYCYLSKNKKNITYTIDLKYKVENGYIVLSTLDIKFDKKIYRKDI